MNCPKSGELQNKIKMPFVDYCTKCFHDMEKYPQDCGCGCHEHLQTLAKYFDVPIEVIIKQVREQQEQMKKDPIQYFEAMFLHEAGLSDIMWKNVRDKVKQK